ncbi:MAG: hypothetical protein PHN57_08450, partial [Candidatus Omnitrophica bacterium]|nr:hypothetical protein [Candidatus Omnitrophota bacterium]
MHKKITGFFLVFISIFFSFAYAQEQLTITTYYPSPNGVYRRVHAENAVVGPAGVGSALATINQDAGNLSIFSYNDGAIFMGRTAPGSVSAQAWKIVTNGTILSFVHSPFLQFSAMVPPISAWDLATVAMDSGGVAIGSDNRHGYKLWVEGNLHVSTDAEVVNNMQVGGRLATPLVNASLAEVGRVNAVDIYSNNLTVWTSKNFLINHPFKPGISLIHSSLEGPEAGVYYRGKGELVKGKAKVQL